MKRILTPVVLSIALALCVASPAALAKSKQKASPEQKAAVKKCNDDYNAAIKEAKGKKGKEHSAAVAAAKKSHKECLATAHK